MPRLVPQLAISYKGTLILSGLLLGLPMDDISSPDLMIVPFKFGMPRLVLQ